MSKPKKGWLPRIEILIVMVFFMSFIIWAASKCKATQLVYEENEASAATLDEEMTEEDTPAEISTQPPATSDQTPGATTPTPAATTPGPSTTPGATTPTPASTTPPPATTNTNETRLFVTIDGLNMRIEPRLNAQIMDKLRLDDEVWFMNEVTDTTQKINLGTIVADEPWVKVKNQKGKVGWVYGAGVHYYKGGKYGNNN